MNDLQQKTILPPLASKDDSDFKPSFQNKSNKPKKTETPKKSTSPKPAAPAHQRQKSGLAINATNAQAAPAGHSRQKSRDANQNPASAPLSNHQRQKSKDVNMGLPPVEHAPNQLMA